MIAAYQPVHRPRFRGRLRGERWPGCPTRRPAISAGDDEEVFAVVSRRRDSRTAGMIVLIGLVLGATLPASAWVLDDGALVAASGEPLMVLGYSVPSRVDWNADGVPDLLIGEGGMGDPAVVRVYPGTGDPHAPVFSSWFHVEADGEVLEIASVGCMGAFPRAVDWNDDERKDLLVGSPLGELVLYINIGTDAAPVFGAADTVRIGEADRPAILDVGFRATPHYVDWNGDEVPDLVIGALDGLIRLFANEGSAAEPLFLLEEFALVYGDPIVVPTVRSSPYFVDVTGDGLGDLVVGNTEGQLLLYANIGSVTQPTFAEPEPILAGAAPLDLHGTPRSRPAVCDWNGDGILDVLVGCGESDVHLFMGLPGTAVPEVLPPIARLHHPWPNPFNPRLSVAFELARSEVATVAVHALDGRLVRVLASRVWAPGRHTLTWNGRDGSDRACASGVYFVRLSAAGGTEQQRVTLVR